MSVRLRILKSAFGGDLFGRTLTCPTIGHPPHDRGTSYTEDFTAPDHLLAKVHNGNGRSDDLAAKDRALDALGERRTFFGRGPDPDPIEVMRRQEQRRQAEDAERAEAQRRQRFALAVWEAARDPRGTAVEIYLRGRGLDLTDDVAGHVLRCHPAGPWGRDKALLMVAAMSDPVTGEVRAVHRTALTPDGQKIDRRMLGPAGGTAIMLTPAAETLAVGEGIESALSAKQLGFGPGVWAMGSAGALGRLPVLDGVQRLVLLEERDSASANAVSDCGHRWIRAGRAVSVVLPTVGKDLNDSLRGIA
jgi:putative DNA primase/helicase